MCSARTSPAAARTGTGGEWLGAVAWNGSANQGLVAWDGGRTQATRPSDTLRAAVERADTPEPPVEKAGRLRVGASRPPGPWSKGRTVGRAV